MDVTDQNELYSMFGVSELSKEPLLVTDVLNRISIVLSEKYTNGICAKYMIKGEKIVLHKLTILTPINTPKSGENIINEHIDYIENPLKDIIKTPTLSNIKIETKPNQSPIVIPKKSCWCF